MNIKFDHKKEDVNDAVGVPLSRLNEIEKHTMDMLQKQVKRGNTCITERMEYVFNKLKKPISDTDILLVGWVTGVAEKSVNQALDLKKIVEGLGSLKGIKIEMGIERKDAKKKKN